MKLNLRHLLGAFLFSFVTVSPGIAAMKLDPYEPPENVPYEKPASSNPQASGAQASYGSGLSLSGWTRRGRTRLSLGAGWGSASNGSYALFSAGAGYFLMNGLEAGLDGEVWTGNSPQIYKVTPGLKYVFNFSERLFPYLGGFYRRVMYSDEAPLDSVGGRAGAYIPMGGRVYAGLGAVFESQLDCDTRVYEYCFVTYPEFSLTFSF